MRDLNSGPRMRFSSSPGVGDQVKTSGTYQNQMLENRLYKKKLKSEGRGAGCFQMGVRKNAGDLKSEGKEIVLWGEGSLVANLFTDTKSLYGEGEGNKCLRERLPHKGRRGEGV